MFKAVVGFAGFAYGLFCFIYAYSQGNRMHYDLGAFFVGAGTAAMLGGGIMFFNAIVYD